MVLAHRLAYGSSLSLSVSSCLKVPECFADRSKGRYPIRSLSESQVQCRGLLGRDIKFHMSACTWIPLVTRCSSPDASLIARLIRPLILVLQGLPVSECWPEARYNAKCPSLYLMLRSAQWAPSITTAQMGKQMENQDIKLRQNEPSCNIALELISDSFKQCLPMGLVWGMVLPTGAPPCKFSSSSDKIPSDRRPQWCALPHPIPHHSPLL